MNPNANIFINEDSFGVKFLSRLSNAWDSFSFQWNDVFRIDAMRIEPDGFILVFWTANDRQKFLAENWQNWNLLEQAIRRRYPDFNWSNFDKARKHQGDLSTRFMCWKCSSQKALQSATNPDKSDSSTK